MPSLNRPNAPNHLPSSDFGNLFSRRRTQRNSDPSSSNSTISPLSFPPNYIGAQPRKRRTIHPSEIGSSGRSSPLATTEIAAALRRPKLIDRDSRHSETSDKSGQFRETSSPLGHSDPLEEEAVLVRRQSSSTVNSKGIRILGISDVAVTPDPPEHDEPRESPSGSRWKREFLGGRLEIRLGKPNGQTSEVPEEVSPPPLSHVTTLGIPSTATVTRRQTSSDSRSSNADSNQRLLEGDSDQYDSNVSAPKEGLYCRTKRALGLKRDPRNHTDGEFRIITPTASLLNRVSSNLREIAVKSLGRSSVNTSVSDLSIAAPRRYRFRPSIVYSTSSSIRERMMGTPPVSTPDPEAIYAARSSRHPIVGMGEDDKPSFLPSEARRITTPPLPDDNTGRRKHRGFFFDYNAPPGPDISPHHSKRLETTRPAESVSDTEWYRKKLDTIDNECNSREDFVASVPEHLPNSPLCPRHAKHKSGGKGLCPYHGQNKVSPPEVEPVSHREEGTLPSKKWW